MPDWALAFGEDGAMKPGPANHVRIARPSHDLGASEQFWVAGLGLEVLFRIDESADGDHALMMVGWPGAAWHLELVHDPDDVTPPAPTEEDLLVLYLGGEIDQDVIRQLVEAGGTRVAARNPYWDQWGVTIADPDGYRLVLSSRSWP
jgi:catechol 2,3-dioxygenase-like lactoylglutathione lyase family enzyme